MKDTLVAGRTTRPSRILIDVAEGRLDEKELDGMEAWLRASAPAEVPEPLVQLGLRARQSTLAPVA